MAKFAAGDTVVGNAQNCHGVTGTDTVLTVTKVGFNTFSGIIDEHPDDDDYVGETHDGLRYEWFDLQESAASICNQACAAVVEPPKRFAPLAWVEYCGEKVRVLGYDAYDEWSGHTVEIMYDDNETEVVDEEDLEPWSAPVAKSVTHRAEDMPKDYKTMNRVQEVIVVMPAHPRESGDYGFARKEERPMPMPIKEHHIPTPSYENVLDKWSTKKRGHIPLRLD